MKIDNFIKKAYEFLNKAFTELEQGEDPILLRDASEKGWGAVVEATNEIFVKDK